ncbi:MAG: type II toxin-antitoxin system VapC family toxin [Thiolinea sp.]|jgi:predicted nucleic acid-binding protein
MNKVLLDTDIVIWLLRKQESYITAFIEIQSKGMICLLSPIVSAEVYAGAFKHEYPIIEQLLGFLTPLVLDIGTAQLAGEYAKQYRKSHNKISLENFLIAATANKENAYLWTNNKKHYPMLEHFFEA